MLKVLIRRDGLAGLLLSCALEGASAWAGVISLEVAATPEVHDDAMILSVTVTNRGDEAAYNLRVSGEVNGEIVSAPPRDQLAPQEGYPVASRHSVQGLKPGSYPVIVRVAYTDANNYPYSALSVAQMVLGTPAEPRIWAVLLPAHFRQEGPLVLRMKNLSDEPVAATTRLIVSQELSATPSETATALGPSEEISLTFHVRSFSALGGSTYPVFAVIEDEQSGLHRTVAVSTQVHLDAAVAMTKRYQPMLLLAAAALLFVLIVRNLRGRRRASS